MKIMKWAAGAVLCALASVASATQVTYDLTKVAGNTWQYDFTITNNTVGAAIPEFAFFFDAASFSNLIEVATPADFAGPFIVQPLLPNPTVGFPGQAGFFDYLTMSGAGLAAGASLGGFVVDVDFSGGPPGTPSFEVYDANLNVLDSGSAAAGGSTAVPEPSTLGLVGMGLIAAGLYRRRSKRIGV